MSVRILQTYPDVREALTMLGGVLDDATMQRQ